MLGVVRKFRRRLCIRRRLHVAGWQWREGSWNAGSLDEIPPLVMQLEAQLHVVRWEWDGREMECWEFEGNLPLVMQP